MQLDSWSGKLVSEEVVGRIPLSESPSDLVLYVYVLILDHQGTSNQGIRL